MFGKGVHITELWKQRNPGILLDKGKNFLFLLDEAKHPGIMDKAVGGYTIQKRSLDAEHDMKQTTADPGVGHLFCLYQVTELVKVLIAVEMLHNTIGKLLGDIRISGKRSAAFPNKLIFDKQGKIIAVYRVAG